MILWQFTSLPSEGIACVLQVLEVFRWKKTFISYFKNTFWFARRFVWNFIRLENEHLNNCGQFRIVRDISIAPVEMKVLVKIILIIWNNWQLSRIRRRYWQWWIILMVLWLSEKGGKSLQKSDFYTYQFTGVLKHKPNLLNCSTGLLTDS